MTARTKECPEFGPIGVAEARAFNVATHSTLPNVQRGPWMFVFGGWYRGKLVAVTFWHNTSARGLPCDWLELRRMAVSSEAPPFFASRMLGWCRRFFKANSDYRRLISYQDTSMHSGTIYRAANWTPTHVSRPRNRDRSGLRSGTARQYRTDSNGKARAAAAKIRWEIALRRGDLLAPLEDREIEAAKSMRVTR